MDIRRQRKIIILSEGCIVLPGYYRTGPVLTPYLEDMDIVKELVENDYCVKIYNTDCSSCYELTKDNCEELIEQCVPIDDSVASENKDGLMSLEDKAKLDSISPKADDVSFTQNLTSGVNIGTITINGESTNIYAPEGGSGGSNAEVIDIRRKYDGNVSDTAGNAVREQVNLLLDKIDQVPEGKQGKSAFEVWKEEYGTPTSTVDDYIAYMQTTTWGAF